MWLYPVAPCVGAWIEIKVMLPVSFVHMSPPVWGRGLKFWQQHPSRTSNCRPLCGGVDWNPFSVQIGNQNFSRPLCGGVDWHQKSWPVMLLAYGRPLCGGVDWNYVWQWCKYLFKWSPPVWGRGLKSTYKKFIRPIAWVAPCVGAWIEITNIGWKNCKLLSPPVWGLCKAVLQCLGKRVPYLKNPQCTVCHLK